MIFQLRTVLSEPAERSAATSMLLPEYEHTGWIEARSVMNIAVSSVLSFPP